MGDLGKTLIVLGAVLVVAGAGLMLAGRLHVPLGKMPGDFVYRGKNTVIYFPLGTSVVVSIVLSVVLYVISRVRR
jgi:Protein of unknown function (DUF2905)